MVYKINFECACMVYNALSHLASLGIFTAWPAPTWPPDGLLIKLFSVVCYPLQCLCNFSQTSSSAGYLSVSNVCWNALPVPGKQLPIFHETSQETTPLLKTFWIPQVKLITPFFYFILIIYISWWLARIIIIYFSDSLFIRLENPWGQRPCITILFFFLSLV